jgi:VWFA-related protein
VAAVTFEVGDGEALIDRDAPFEVSVDLPMIPRAATIRVVALDAGGAELGRDQMEINGFEGELRLAIREPRRITGPGTYDVALEVRSPRGAGLATVDLFWGERHLETLRHPPYRSSLVVPAEARGGFLLARASLPGGGTSEAAVAMGKEGFGDRLDVDLVQLSTVVRDRRGRPVDDLERDDFRVREEGRDQSLRTVGRAADTPLAVGLAVDVSTSVDEDFPLVKAAAIRFLRQVLGPRDRGQLVAFAGRPWLVAPLTGDLERLAGDIDALSVASSTALHDAVMLSLFHLRGVTGRKAIVLLTDGRDTVSRHSALQSLELARRSGIPVYVLVLGSSDPRSPTAGLHRLELASLATATGGRLHLVRSLDQLAPAYDQIAEELRSQYLLTYASDGEDPATAGWRRVDVDVKRPGLTARTLAGYFKEP